jgi:hypothetical protein
MKSEKQIEKKIMDCLDEIDALDKNLGEKDGTPKECTEIGKAIGRLESLLWVLGK